MPAKYIDINILPPQSPNDYKIGVPGTARVTFGGYRLGNPVGVSSASSVSSNTVGVLYITQHPQNASVLAPDSATFSVSAYTNVGTLSYRWKRNGDDVGTDSSTYATGATTWTGSDDTVYCVVSNGYGSVISNNATLIIGRSYRRWAINEGSGTSFAENSGGASMTLLSGSAKWDSNGFRFRNTTYAGCSAAGMLDMPTGSGAFWVSHSVRFEVLSGTRQTIGYGRLGGGSKSFIGFFASGTNYALFLIGPSSGSWAIPGVTLVSSTWLHMIMQYNAGIVTIYLNGTAAGSGLTIPTIDLARETLRLGEDLPPQTDTLDGYLRNVSCGGGILDTTQIQTIYNRDKVT